MEAINQLQKKGYTVFCLFEEIEGKEWKIYVEKPARFSSIAIVETIQEIGYNVTVFDISFPGLLCIHFRNGPPVDDYLFVSSRNRNVVTETEPTKKILFGTLTMGHVKFGNLFEK